MEKRKFEKKIEDWATGLGFCLPDGSSPPPNFFAALTATPNRRQLWEILIESIQPKKRVEYVRKQLLVNQLKERKKNIDNKKTMKINGKLELWDKQNELEEEIKKERKACIDLEQKIFSKSSDLMFEMCKIDDLEKQSNEWKDKAFALNLFNRKGKRIVDDFDKILVPSVNKSKNDFLNELHQINLKEEVQKLGQQIACATICDAPLNSDHDCELRSKLESIRESGVTEDLLWEEALNQKKVVLEELLNCLNSLGDFEKNLLERESEIKEDLNNSIVKLKKEILEKSMQIVINETQGRILDCEVEKLMENAEMLILKNSPDRNLNESLPYVTQEEIDKSFSFKQKSLSQLRKYVNSVGRKSYYESLKGEVAKVEGKLAKAREECSEAKLSERKLEETFKSIESTAQEIWNLKSQCDDQDKRIMQLNDERNQVIASSPEKIGLDKTLDCLRDGLLRQVELFLQIPLDALRNSTENHSKNSSHFPMYDGQGGGGDTSHFFGAALKLPPEPSGKEFVARETETRRKVKEEIEKFIREREKLSDLQKKIFSRASSITYDSKFCEKNFKESDGMLSAVQFRADELTAGIGFIEKVLKNWLEQPYRHMLDGVKVNGKTLEEFEKAST